MTDEVLYEHLKCFLQSPLARSLCRRYAVEPRDALGELFIRLSPKARQPILKPDVWVKVNAAGRLRNFLRTEHRGLRQAREV